MLQQNTALIDDIMAALDAESSQNVELIVRNTQNGATKKMALASLEQIIYSYLTTAPVVTNLASVLGASGSLRHIKNILKSETIQLAANSTYEVPGSLSGIIIISCEAIVADTVIAATVYGTTTVTLLAPQLTGRFTLSKVHGMGNLIITNTGDASELSYTFISSGSQYDLP